MRPCAGLMNPSSVLSNVLFPAPFGPSRPTAPALKRADTSFSARFAPKRTVTASRCTTGASVDDRCGSRVAMTLLVSKSYPIRSVESQRSAQTERVGALAHERDHIRDVLIERKSDFFRAFSQIVAADGPREGLVLHSAHDRRRLEVEDAFRRPHQRARGYES